MFLHFSESSMCFPFRVAFDEVIGHQLVSTRDLAALDLILREPTALPSGTFAETKDPTCLSCYSILVDEEAKVKTNSLDYVEDDQMFSLYSICANCNLPLCASDKQMIENSKSGKAMKGPCNENSIHKDFECKLFQERNMKLTIPPDSKDHPFYNVLKINHGLSLSLCKAEYFSMIYVLDIKTKYFSNCFLFEMLVLKELKIISF